MNYLMIDKLKKQIFKTKFIKKKTTIYKSFIKLDQVTIKSTI